MEFLETWSWLTISKGDIDRLSSSDSTSNSHSVRRRACTFGSAGAGNRHCIPRSLSACLGNRQALLVGIYANNKGIFTGPVVFEMVLILSAKMRSSALMSTS
eukprot:scaffold193_cov139-Amphora_coffeaeformis.AAC.4